MKIQAEKISRDLFDERYSKVDDPVLTAEINLYMRAQYDLEEILSDPAIDEIRSETAAIINSWKEDVLNIRKAENKNYIRKTLSEAPESKIKDDLKDIRLDLSKNNINDISTEWVEEWHRKKQMQGTISEERANFITSSLEEKGSEEERKDLTLNAPTESKSINLKKTGRTLVIRFVSLSAAAVIGTFLVIRSLQPYDTQKLYRSYYEPFNAVSPVVRGSNPNDLYISAMNSYKAGDYNNAALAFEQSANINPSFGSPVFYLGLTALETGDYNEAIKDLGSVVRDSGVYSKDAKWYLGLAYLKTGSREKASECFKELSLTSSYYKERSEKILRHLK